MPTAQAKLCDVRPWRLLTQHLAAVLDAYNFAKRLKTLRGLTLYETI